MGDVQIICNCFKPRYLGRIHSFRVHRIFQQSDVELNRNVGTTRYFVASRSARQKVPIRRILRIFYCNQPVALQQHTHISTHTNVLDSLEAEIERSPECLWQQYNNHIETH